MHLFIFTLKDYSNTSWVKCFFNYTDAFYSVIFWSYARLFNYKVVILKSDSLNNSYAQHCKNTLI